ncbi:alpha/beta fold hydrolase [Microbacterium marinilacus]|uniref:AB hydrolase-1 domain-containing protein n=1 Tax=Microbacterium marinilacus TaxID=415209 RepID=A0ABP7BXY7_9MICO|nr:alpha/beta hydrolase [Microbacterium marinilacus]MBY0688047.1 alpha/beta hydrolase [Microbacterium marinilacus]
MRLFTRELGSGPRTAALVHGASESSTAWHDFASILVEKHDLSLILVDQRGHGESPRSDSYTLETFTQDLIDTLPVGLDLLIGQSLGGRVAAEAAPALAPRRFIGIDPGFAVSWRFGMAMRLMNRVRPLMSRAAIRRAGIKRTGAGSIDRQMANWDAWDSRMVPYLATTGRRTEYTPRPPAVPSTIVLAEDSVVVSPERAREFGDLGWDVRTLPGAPHDMHIQMPTQLAALLDDLLTA